MHMPITPELAHAHQEELRSLAARSRRVGQPPHVRTSFLRELGRRLR